MAESRYRTLLVPYDFSQHARLALDTAIELGGQLGEVTVHLLHVVHTPIYAYAADQGVAGTAASASLAVTPPAIDMSDVRAAAEKSLDEVREVVTERPDSVTVPIEIHVVEGVALDRSICEMAEQLDADLIVMGTHGRTGLAQVFLGSVAARTLRRAPCPVVTVRAEDDEEEDDAQHARA